MLNEALMRRRLGDQLRRYRKFTGQSQAAVARRIGILPTTLGAYERGSRWPHARHLAALIEGGCLNPAELFGEEAREATA